MVSLGLNAEGVDPFTLAIKKRLAASDKMHVALWIQVVSSGWTRSSRSSADSTFSRAAVSHWSSAAIPVAEILQATLPSVDSPNMELKTPKARAEVQRGAEFIADTPTMHFNKHMGSVYRLKACL